MKHKDFGFSDFCAFEFKSPLTIEKLCKVINDDNYEIRLCYTLNTIEWLNELLESSNLFNIIYLKKKTEACFSKDVIKLIKKARKYLKQDFSGLSKEK